MLRVVITDDSMLYRTLLNSIIKSTDGLELVGSAGNGRDALEKLKKLNVDVLILDLEMPIMDGLEVLRNLKNQENSPVVIVCSSLTTQGAKVTMEALRLGAYDVIAKPDGDSVNENFNRLSGQISRLFESLKQSHEVRALKEVETPVVPHRIEPIKLPSRMMKVLAIGISTGGPRALLKLLPLLPKDFPGIVLIVQHMPEQFIPSLVESLNRVSNMKVKIVKEGEMFKPSNIYISPGSHHLGLLKNDSGALQAYLSEEKPENHCRPSINYLYRSIAAVCGNQCVALIMTGMGNDGTSGAKDLKENGGYILAQEESSCTVYGMPRSIVAENLQDHVVALDDMADTVKRIFRC